MPISRHLLAACAALACLTAQAQVLRCTDARTGEVTYTDGACQGGASVREVEPRKTPQEIQRERQQAAEALERKQQQQQAEAATRQQEADREREKAARAPRTPRPHNHAASAECKRSRQNLAALVNSPNGTYDQQLQIDNAQRQMDLDCLGPEGYAEVEKARAARQVTPPSVVLAPPRRPIYTAPAAPPSQPQQPREMKQCNVFRCYDNQGNIYPR